MSKELLNQVVQTPTHHYYLTKHLGYDYTISYKLGRRTGMQTHFLDFYGIVPSSDFLCPNFWFHEAITNWTQQFLWLTGIAPGSGCTQWHPSDGMCLKEIIYRNWKLVLSKDSHLKSMFLDKSINVKYEMARQEYQRHTIVSIQHNMGWHEERYCRFLIAICKVCQQTKYMPKAPTGLLRPIEPPTQVCQDMSRILWWVWLHSKAELLVRYYYSSYRPNFKSNTLWYVINPVFSLLGNRTFHHNNL